MNMGYSQGAAASANKFQHGYEAASDRIADQTQRIREQIERLSGSLSPVLDDIASIPAAGKDVPGPSFSSELLQNLNNRADALSDVADRLEALIGRIRL